MSNVSSVKCTACHGVIEKEKEFIHPLLFVPICKECNFRYGDGDKDFVVEEGNEIYCRACGEGQDALLLCDSCPKSFCSRCIGNMFGQAELRRIASLDDRWHCFVCSPLPIVDLCMRNGWDHHYATKRTESVVVTTAAAAIDRKSTKRSSVIHYDVSNGREKFDIPVVNEVDNALPPTDFTYICSPVAGPNVVLANDPSTMKCCSCVDNCRDPLICECAIMSGGVTYDSNGVLLQERPGAIYECNYRCSCHKSRCSNRVVGNGPRLRLEVFRCDDPRKGWGLRCQDDIDRGTFVADYIGLVIPEREADIVGLTSSDEYLYTVDFWGRTKASQIIKSLGLKDSISKMPREIDMDGGVLCREDISKCLNDPELFRLLDERGAIDRSYERKKKLREDPMEYLRQQDVMYGNDADDCWDAQSDKQHGKVGRSCSSDGVSSRRSRDHRARDQKRKVGSSPKVVSRGRKTNNLSMSDLSTLRDAFRDGNTDTGKEGKNPSSYSGGQENMLSLSWYDLQKMSRQKALDHSTTVLQDRVILETEQNNETFVLDARWYGNVARFINHSCTANLDIHSVFCDSHDIRLPRIAFMANQYIKANTELTYDYGYLTGNVEGKHRDCLCGSTNCRIKLY